MATTYDKASLVMIPSGYKDDKLYSIKPTDGSGDFTFSRDGAGASPATRVNASGLIEKGRTNELAYSNTFSNAVWDKVGVTLTTGQADPFGGNNATKVDFAGGVNAYLAQGNLGSTNVRTRSIWMRADSNIEVSFSDGVTANAINITTSWVRYEAFISTIPASGLQIDNYFSLTTPQQAISVYVYAAQVEDGLVATDYIETTTAPVSAGLLGDMPRLDYSGGATCPSLLLEPSRVNLVPHSEYFGSFTNTEETTLTPNATTSPEGVSNAYAITPQATTNFHRIVADSFTTTSGVDTTISMYVKPNGYNYLLLRTSTGTNDNVAFNLSDGSVTYEESGYTAFIEDAGNGWYRVGYTKNFSIISPNVYIRFQPTATTNSSIAQFTGDGTSGGYIYGFQVEANASYPTSYIPTYGSASTRGVDNGNKVLPDSILGTDYNEGTLFFELELNQEAITRAVSIVSGFWTTSSVRIECTPSTGLFACDIVNASVGATGTSISVSPLSKGDTIKCALAWNNGTFVFYANGQSTSGSCPVMTTKIYNLYLNRLGTFNGVGNYESNDFKQVLVFPTALTNAELAALTTL